MALTTADIQLIEDVLSPRIEAVLTPAVDAVSSLQQNQLVLINAVNGLVGRTDQIETVISTLVDSVDMLAVRGESARRPRR